MSGSQARVLTLCEKCRELYEASSYSLKPLYYDNTTTIPEKKCSHCKKVRQGMKMYIIDTKRK